MKKNGKSPKHAGGRPPKYSKLEKFQKKVNEYFDFCDNRTGEIHSEKWGDMIVFDPEPYTMSGLAYALDLSRQGLIDYSKKNKFLDTIKKARNRIEADQEKRLSDKKTFTPGIIFNLKNNFGWRDRTETDVTSGGKPIPILGGKDVHQDTSDKETSEVK